MKHILYATDCSKHEAHTLQYAYLLSDILKADLTVLHVFSLSPIGASTMRPKEYLRKQACEEQFLVLKRYCYDHLKDIQTGVHIKYEVTEDISVTKGILSKIATLSPDLLMLGMKDEHTARGLFTGSIAKVLIEKVATPILIVPSTNQFQKIKSLVYATDFEDADILAIKKLVKIAAPFDAIIKIVHVANKDESVKNDKMEWFKEIVFEETRYKNITFDIIYNDTVYEGLRAYIDITNADMIGLLEREDDGFLKKLFHKDLIKRMESNSTIPMLSFNAIGLLELSLSSSQKSV